MENDMNGGYRTARVKVTREIREALTGLLQQEADFLEKKKHPAKWYRDEAGKALKLADRDNPSLRSYEVLLSEIRPRLLKHNPIDDPWSITTLDNWPIPPDALPIVLKAYKRHFEDKTDFSIRQAKWVARLSRTDYHDTAVPDAIARTEQLCEMGGIPLDLKIVDKLLAGLEAKGEEGKLPMFFWASFSVAGALKNDPLNKEEKGGEKH
jgi:hypothetical protein